VNHRDRVHVGIIGPAFRSGKGTAVATGEPRRNRTAELISLMAKEPVQQTLVISTPTHKPTGRRGGSVRLGWRCPEIRSLLHGFSGSNRWPRKVRFPAAPPLLPAASQSLFPAVHKRLIPNGFASTQV